MLGYHNDPDETKNVIRKHKDGKFWVHTGDLGFISERGFVHIVGRIKRYMLCISNGVQKKVFSLDIEKALNNNPLVEKSVVVPMDDIVKNQVPVAFVKCIETDMTKQRIRSELESYCNENLDQAYRPVKYIFATVSP